MKARPGAEPRPQKKARASAILRKLKKEFPGAATALEHQNAFQLLVATILSAQCTDERVNMVTPSLFARYPDAARFAGARQEDVEDFVRSTGFFRMKSRNIIACSKALVERYGGRVPNTMEELRQLPGVGRKTANVVLGHAFGVSEGVVVDTHVGRLSQRMGFTTEKDAERIETDLMELFPRKEWLGLGSVLILHGRRTCTARKPACDDCPVQDLCPSAGRV
jgi:endonuclease-3